MLVYSWCFFSLGAYWGIWKMLVVKILIPEVLGFILVWSYQIFINIWAFWYFKAKSNNNFWKVFCTLANFLSKSFFLRMQLGKWVWKAGISLFYMKNMVNFEEKCVRKFAFGTVSFALFALFALFISTKSTICTI